MSNANWGLLPHEWVKRARALRGLSQVELAERLGVGQQWISRLERGEQQPELESLHRVAQALGLRVEAFAGEGAEGFLCHPPRLPEPEEPLPRSLW